MATHKSRSEKFYDYDAFVEKYKQKKTTDDCYTPESVYEAVLDWVCNEYRIDKSLVVRPFYPGGDYENFDYSGGKVVVDNPPFSIMSKIVEFYQNNGIKFFLFGPSLTLFSGYECCRICTDCNIEYENGAVIPTGFKTNLEECAFRTAPSLSKAVNDAVKEIATKTKKHNPKYEYPYCVATAARTAWLDRYGIEIKVMPDECIRVNALDMQKKVGKTIFGSGFILSARAAAERAAAERAAAEKEKAVVWQLSEREMQMQRSLR